MRPEEICEQMRNLLPRIRAIIARAPLYSAVLGPIDRMLTQLGNMNGTFDGFSAEDLSAAFAELRRKTTTAVNTLSNIRHKRDNTYYSSAEKKALQALASLDGKLSQYDPLVKEYVDAERNVSRYSTNYPANKNRHIASMRQLTANGMRPGYRDCEKMTLPAEKDDRQNTYAAFIWLGIQHAKSYAAGAPESVGAGIYTRTFDRMRDELRTAPPTCRAQLARCLAQYECYMLSKAKESLQAISGGRTNLSQEELAQAIRDPAITQAAAFANFRQALEKDPLMAHYIHTACRDTIGRDYDAVKNVVEQASAPVQEGRPAIAQAVNDRRNAMREDVNASGFSVASKEGRLCELYDRLGEAEEKDGTVCQAMRNTLKKVIDDRKLINENDESFRKAMHDCERASRDYVTTHSKNPFSTRAKNRMAAADEMMRLSRGYTDAYAQERERQSRAEIEKMPQRSDPQSRIKLSKLQKVIAPVHTVPKVAKAVNTVSKYRSSGFGHKVANVTNFVMTNTVGLVGAAISEAVTHQSDKGISKPLDPTRVPGSRYDHYHDEVDENGLFYDRRKIPLIWAREIPEEPTGDIEFSIEVEQAKEGTDFGSDKGNGFREKDAIGAVGPQYGHAFITLKYTQKDPLTGQPKRYKTSFGFYPESTFGTGAQLMNSAQYGSKQMGRIVSDFGHEVSIGQTFKISPDQFNKIVTLTQNYEKGGYNVMTRNCVTFTKACVDEIELEEAKKLFEETDLNSDWIAHSAGSGGVNLGFGYAAKAVAKNELYKLQDVDAFFYQRYGQKLVSEEDLKMQDMESYNKRAKGYSPGFLGEKMREKENIPLHTNKWEGTKNLRKEALLDRYFVESPLYTNSTNDDMSEKDKMGILEQIANEKKKAYNMVCLEKQFNRLQDKIRELPDFKTPADKAALNETLNKMKQFSDNLLDGMGFSLSYIDINNEKAFSQNGNYEYKHVDYTKKKQAYHDLAKLCDAYTSGMNDIFRDTFRSDPRLDLEFGKVISFAERIKDLATAEYPNFVREDRIGFDDLAMLEGEFDISRSGLRSLYDIKCRDKDYFYNKKLPNGNVKEYKQSMKVSPLEAYAAIKVYGSLENAVELINRSNEIDVDDFYDMKKRYEAAILQDKKELVIDLGKSMETKLGRYYVPTAEDINVIFNKLPCSEKCLSRDERNTKNSYTNMYFSSNALKGLIFEKYFGGFEEQAKDFAMSMREQDAVEILTAEDHEEQEVFLENVGGDVQLANPIQRRQAFVNSKKSDMDKKMLKFISDKVNGNFNTKSAFEKMKNETAKFLYYNETGEHYDPKKPGAKDKLSTYSDKAEARLVRDIIGTYLEPQLDYQLIREFKGPQATNQDKKIYQRMGNLQNANTDPRLFYLEKEYAQALQYNRQQNQPQNRPEDLPNPPQDQPQNRNRMLLG